MGIDWQTVSLSAYLEALEAYNEANDPATSAANPGDMTGLARLMKAHSGG